MPGDGVAGKGQTYARALCMALWTSHWISAESRAPIGLAQGA